MPHNAGDEMISEHRKLRKCHNEKRAEADLAIRLFFLKLLDEQRLSRIQIAEILSEILGEEVSLSRLDSYVATTKTSARLPAYFIRAICEALDSDEILLYLARPALRKKIEFAESVRELRCIVDDLARIQEPNAKRKGLHA
jgi:hypothetical protein